MLMYIVIEKIKLCMNCGIIVVMDIILNIMGNFFEYCSKAY